MAPFMMRNKILPATSYTHHVQRQRFCEELLPDGGDGFQVQRVAGNILN